MINTIESGYGISVPWPPLEDGPMRAPQKFLIAVTVVLTGYAGSANAAPAATDPQPNRIRIEYVPPTSPEHQQIYQMVQERKALEKLQEIFGAFKLPADLLLRTVGCDGVSNAWYQRGRVSVCYEYLEDVRRMMPAETTPEGVTPGDAVAGQLFYALAHEMGHAMFDMLDIPVLGRQEDAADQFATYIMLQFGKDQARRLITGAAVSYRRFLTNPKVTAPLAAFSDTHSPPATRFFNMICLAFGADRELFADFVTKEYLPKQRAGNCRREYGEIVFAFQRLVVPHLDMSIAQRVMQTNWLPDQDGKPRPN
jgi:hypothetical protein